VWLDHRGLAQQEDMATMHHAHDASASRPDGVAMAQRSKLYVASLDGAVAPRAITGGVCYCCKTALATGIDGSLFAAWRHVYPGNIRDIAFTVSRDGGRSFAAPLRVSEDKWELDGCPDDGPAMAVDAHNRVHIVWPTLVSGATPGSDPTIALFYATSTDGRGFTPRERIPAEGMAHHPQIAIGPDGSPTVAWDEGANGACRAIIARAAADGQPRFAREVIGGLEAGVYPVVAPVRDGIVVAWTSGVGARSVVRVERVPAAR
jgi:hypothetical protein